MKKCTLFIMLSMILILNQNSYAAKTTILEQESYTDTDTAFFDAEGNKVFLDQFEPNTVLLVFWATWCGTCTSEMPMIDNLAKDFRKLPFKVVALSQDYQGVEVIKKYFTDNDIRHIDIYHDYQNVMFRSMEVVGMPSAYLINGNGKIKKLFKGRIKWYDDEIRAIILGEIDGNPEMPKNSYKASSLNVKIERVEPKTEVIVKEPTPTEEKAKEQPEVKADENSQNLTK
jgi:thiol-disulfide isomerase/thioredoxin